jgi:5-methylcytosine-specific restriction endonuclease McrA
MTRKRGTDTEGQRFNEEQIQSVWEKGKKIAGKDPNLYREDAVGNIIYRRSYGKISEMGWEVDHKKPVDKGGTDNLRNLQPLQTEENREKGKQYPWKPE